MITKRLLPITLLGLTLLTLSACSSKGQETKTPAKKEITTLQSETGHLQNPNIRLKFNEIKTGSAENGFKGGSTLEELKALYGEPSSHTTKPAGDVTLDVYSWDIEEAKVNAQLYENSTIARAISNFSFDRKQTITKKIFDDKIHKDMTFTQATEALGQPDVMSEAVSSDGEIIQALWSSNLKGKNQVRQIELIFTNQKLTDMKQTGLE